MKTEIEIQAAKVVKDWVDRFYELTVNGKPLDPVYRKKMASCDVCYVGDFRSRNGLTRYYWRAPSNFKPELCNACLDFANSFFVINKAEYPVRNFYLATLTNFLEHMKTHHVPN